MRIGHGYDVHAFGDGDHIIIGGVRISHHQGLVAHSDGDVIIHAFCDGLLGAAGLGDIGRHFPDTDADYRNIDSRILLRKVIELLSSNGWMLGNADITVVAEAPKIAPHVNDMVANLASDCAVDRHRINIKATTTEKLGFTGRNEGIACHCVVLLEPLGLD